MAQIGWQTCRAQQTLYKRMYLAIRKNKTILTVYSSHYFQLHRRIIVNNKMLSNG